MFVIDGVETTTLGMRFDLYQYMGCIDINFAIYFEKKKKEKLDWYQQHISSDGRVGLCFEREEVELEMADEGSIHQFS